MKMSFLAALHPAASSLRGKVVPNFSTSFLLKKQIRMLESSINILLYDNYISNLKFWNKKNIPFKYLMMSAKVCNKFNLP